MRFTSGFKRHGRGTAGHSLWVSACWVLAVAGVPWASVWAAEQQSPDSQRAQTPLAEIAGPVTSAPATLAPDWDSVPEVRDAYEQARAQIEDGRPQAAVETLMGLAGQPDANRYEIHYLLALARSRLGQLDGALASAQQAARLAHDVADVHYLLGELHRRRGEVDSAIAHYRTATLAAEQELNNAKVTLAWYYLGVVLAQGGYDRAAAQAYGHFDAAVWQTHPEQRNASEIAGLLVERPHGMISERVELLDRLERRGEAVRVAEWACDVWPDDVLVARLYAETLLSAGAAEEAFGFCRRRLEELEDASVLLPVAIDAAQASDQLEDWVNAVARKADEGGAIELGAGLTRQLNRVGAAEQAVCVGRAVLSQRTHDPDVTWEVVAALQTTGDVRGALQTLITFVRDNPDGLELTRRRLVAWTEWFDSRTDVAELVEGLRAEQDADFATDFVLGVSALAAGRDSLADELLQSCLGARPDFGPAHVARGKMLLARYQWEAAKACARRVLQDQPGLAAAYYVLAEAHEGLDENEQAESAYKQAIKFQPHEPLYKLALARHHRRRENLLGAQRYFQEALADEPGNGEALEGLIDCYLRGDKVEIARALMERMEQDQVPKDSWRRAKTSMGFLSAPFGKEHLAELKLQYERNPDDPATARLLAGGLYFRNRLDEACQIAQEVRNASPDEYHLTILLANIHAVRGEFGQAIGLLQELTKRFPNRLAVLEPLALCCIYDFRFEEGRPALRRLVELEEDEDRRSEYREKLRDSYLMFGEFDQALRLVEGWLQDEPRNDSLLLHKAIVLIHADRSDDASAVLEEWLERSPDDIGRRERFYRSVRATQQYEPVLKRIREWLEADSSSALLTGWLIDVLIWADRPDEAFEVARDFEGTYVESMTRRIWLGRCQAAKGEIDKALAEFDALLNERLLQDRQRMDIWRHIAETLLMADRSADVLARCEQWLKQAEDLHPVFRPIALDWKRRASQDAGKDRESAEVMEALLPYVPDVGVVLDDPGYSAGLFNDLGYVWVDLGMNLEQATGLIRQAVAAEPWNAAFIDSLGWAYYKAGGFADARKYLARAVRLRDGQDAVVYDHLGDAAYRLGDQEAARRNWGKALALLEAETSERMRARQADAEAAVRAKLVSLERSEAPPVAPTAAEQQEE